MQITFCSQSISLFMDRVQLPQGYRATIRRQFTFYDLVPRDSWYSFYRPRKDERLSRPWSHPVVLNWESSVLASRPLLHEISEIGEISRLRWFIYCFVCVLLCICSFVDIDITGRGNCVLCIS